MLREPPKSVRLKREMRIPIEKKRQILKLRLKNKGIRQIAKEVHVGTKTVQRVLLLPDVQRRLEDARNRVLVRASEMAERMVAIAMGERHDGDGRLLLDALKGLGILREHKDVTATISAAPPGAMLFQAVHGRPPVNDEELLEFRRKTIPPATLRLLKSTENSSGQ